MALLLIVMFATRGYAFDYFEHRYIGNVAYERASKEILNKASESFRNDLIAVELDLGFLKLGQELCRLGPACVPSAASRGPNGSDTLLLDEMPLRFGDLSALGGDHTGTPEALEKMVKAFRDAVQDTSEHERILATRRHWLNACRWYRTQAKSPVQWDAPLNRCFDESSNASDPPANIETGSAGYVPSRSELSEFERLAGFVRLAKDNREHFPRHSWKQYIDAHRTAMELARKYAETNSHRELRSALIYEGYAQHFLHDSFSSGHIGTAFGVCRFESVPLVGKLIPVWCSPGKQIVQHTHDYLNALGLPVFIAEVREPVIVPDSDDAKRRRRLYEQAKKGWTAFGDRHLFIVEAAFHRRIAVEAATDSILSVLDAARERDHLLEPASLCKQWKGLFPIPKDASLNWDECRAEDPATKDLVRLKHGRSADPRVPDLPMEGWKFLVTWGNLYGKFTHLNQDGTPRGTRHSVTAGTFELGYIRSTEWWMPNYLGFGATIAPGNRISIYPTSVGYWRAPASRSWFYGIRFNAGVRITEPFSTENPHHPS